VTTARNHAKRAAGWAYHKVPTALDPRFLHAQVKVRRRLRRAGPPICLHLGCGSQRFENFINIDMKRTPATDYVCDIAKLPCRDISVQRIEAYHLIEHIPHPDAPIVLAEWFRVLTPGGHLVLECPDFDAAARRYLDGDDRMLASIYGWQRYPGDTHYIGYNADRLSALLRAAGFSEVKEEPAQDYHAAEEPCLRLVATR
jgi:predicted SAM-dependent methyltransferase